MEKTNHEGYKKDPKTGVVINTNYAEYEHIKEKREHKKEVSQLSTELNALKDELDLIKKHLIQGN